MKNVFGSVQHIIYQINKFVIFGIWMWMLIQMWMLFEWWNELCGMLPEKGDVRERIGLEGGNILLLFCWEDILIQFIYIVNE